MMSKNIKLLLKGAREYEHNQDYANDEYDGYANDDVRTFLLLVSECKKSCLILANSSLSN